MKSIYKWIIFGLIVAAMVVVHAQAQDEEDESPDVSGENEEGDENAGETTEASNPDENLNNVDGTKYADQSCSENGKYSAVKETGCEFFTICLNGKTTPAQSCGGSHMAYDEKKGVCDFKDKVKC